MPSGPRTVVTAVLAGLLLAASVPPWGWWPTAFVGIALLDRLLEGQPARRRFWRTTGVAAAWLFPGTVWMWDLTPPGWLIANALHSAYFGLGASLLPAGRGRRIGLVGVVILGEFARWSWPFGGVPLATLPMGQAAGPLAPVVRVGGPLLLAALVVVVGVGGPASMVGFDLGRSFNPPDRLGAATGIINQGGFVASLLLVVAIGLVLDWRTPGASTDYAPGAFRWAMSVQYVLWAVGLTQIWRYRRRTRAQLLAEDPDAREHWRGRLA